MNLPEINSLSDEALKDFKHMYDYACERVGGDIAVLPYDKQKKAARLVCEDWQDALRARNIPENVPDAAGFCVFLKRCAEADAEKTLAFMHDFESALEFLPADVAEALRGRFDTSVSGKRSPYFEMRCSDSGKELKLLLEYDTAYEIIMTAEVLEWQGKTPSDGRHDSTLYSFKRDGEVFAAEFGDYDKCESGVKYTARFDKISVEGITFRAYEGSREFPVSAYGAAEWAARAAGSILRKSQCRFARTNDKELAIIPLARELKALEWCEQPENGFPLLEKAAEEYGVPALRDVLKSPGGENSANRRRAIYKYLRRAECEPLVMKIVNAIADSQEEYPPRGTEAPSVVREVFESRLHGLGWEGFWPDFKKQIKTDGGKKERDIFGERHALRGGEAVCFIHCDYDACEPEDEFDAEYCGSVSAFCGTRIIKPGDRDFGMASCLFFDGDFRMVRAVEKDIYEDADPASQTVIEALVSGAEEVASAAAKLAEAKPLTNEEEKLCLRYYGMGAASSARNPFTATIIVYLLIVAVEFIGVFAVSGLLALLTQDASVFAVLKNTLAWLFIVPAIVLAAIFGIYYGFNLFVRIRNKQKGKKKKPAE